MRTAVLTGTRRNPALVLRFVGRERLPRAARLPRARRRDLPPISHPPTMLDWVRRIPGRRWNPELEAWVATSVGPDPDAVLAAAEFTVDLGKAPAQGITAVAQLYDPLVELSTDVPARFDVGPRTRELAVVWPRLSGYEACLPAVPAAARWLTEPGCWVVETADLHDAPALPVPAHVVELARQLHAERVSSDVDPEVQARAAVLAASRHIDDVRDTADELIATAGCVPPWFGFDLFGYQQSGALAVATTHSVLVDEPGLGKSAQALAAAAVRRVERLVIVCPPVVNTNWQREVERSGLVEHMPGGRAEPGPASATGGGDEPAKVVRIVTGRKEPALPDRGVVIVSDSLLAHRPALLERLQQWRPQGLFYDEAHRAQTFDSARATAVRTLAESVGDGLRVPISGTPMSKGPMDLAGILAVSGHLDTVFGGHSQYLDTFCKRDHFNGWVPKPEMLPTLRATLEQQVWTRRTKAQVLPDLPKKLRTATYLDVDLSGFNAAHASVIEVIEEWVTSFYEAKHRFPSTPGAVDEGERSEVESWALGQVGLVTQLRVAAGLAKVDAATALIREHVAATSEPGQRVYDRPLVVWVHHRPVGLAMMQAVPEAVARTAVIRGGTSADQRGRIVDDFQAGKVPVLVASIAAAGVGITLTRGCDMKFVETDWTVSNVTQAEDRECRIGQTRPVAISTLIAPGTLDERIQAVLAAKSKVLDEVLTGGDNSPAVALDNDAKTTPAQIIAELAMAVIAARSSSRNASRRRAA